MRRDTGEAFYSAYGHAPAWATELADRFARETKQALAQHPGLALDALWALDRCLTGAISFVVMGEELDRASAAVRADMQAEGVGLSSDLSEWPSDDGAKASAAG